MVDSTGFNDQSWLDDAGHPHSDAMHAIERFRRPTSVTWRFRLRLTIRRRSTKPWSVNLNFEYAPDTDLIEDICDNEQDTALSANRSYAR